MDRKNVYFNEYNVRMGKATYIPLVSGILHAYAETDPLVADHYRFMPYVFCMDRPEAILDAYQEPPAVAAFSVAMWNEQLSLTVARKLKERWPECLVVFGGAQVPHYPESYLDRFPFIDVAVRAEGEEAFIELLRRFITSRDFAGVPNVSYRDPDTGAFRHNLEHPNFERSLDYYPSPYLTGKFDYLFEAHPEVDFQAIIETNRGCPFLCTFCYWGRGGTTRKYRYHEIKRVLGEISWAGKNRILYLFNADSNFGMHKRDREIAEHLVSTKKAYGYPEKFRTCWGKNTDETIFGIAKLLHDHNLDKGITLSRQSNSKEVLVNIKRGNIKHETYTNLQRIFNDHNISVYTELILGLPGETEQSWRAGIEETLRSGLKNQLMIYVCEIYPNTDLAEEAYRAKFGIKSRVGQLREIHGTIRDQDWIPEHQEFVYETSSMPNAVWRKMYKFSILVMLLHSLKLGMYILSYLFEKYAIEYIAFVEFLMESPSTSPSTIVAEELGFYDRYIDDLMKGEGRGVEYPKYGNLYWDVEEASFLRIVEQKERFYAEIAVLLRTFLDGRRLPIDDPEIDDVLRYQQMRVPSLMDDASVTHRFAFNVPEYMDRLFGNNPIHLAPRGQLATVTAKVTSRDPREFARQVLLWGRKSGAILNDCHWEALESAHPERVPLQAS